MGESTKIEWCDHTFNPWIGCSKVHAGCANCYAEAAFDFRLGVADWGPNGSRFLTSEGNWLAPMKWCRAAERDGVRRRVFCASLSDVFEEWPAEKPVLGMNRDVMRRCLRCKRNYPKNNRVCDQCNEPGYSANLRISDVRDDLFLLIDATPSLDWLLLTKRPENIPSMWADAASSVPNHQPHSDGRDNVWLGTSISDQASADKQIPELLKCRDLSPVLFLSVEPLLGPVDLRLYLNKWSCPCICHDSTHVVACSCPCNCGHGKAIDWVIVGGESGPNARPMHSTWVRSIRDQCRAAGVPFFFKQWGEWLPISDASIEVMQSGDRFDQTDILNTGLWGDQVTPQICREQADLPELCYRVGKKAAGRLLDGREWSEFPPEPMPF